MSRAVFTPEVDAYIREHAYGLRTSKLTRMLNEELGTNYTAEQVSNYKHRQKIKPGVSDGSDSPYPEDFEDVVRELAPGRMSHELARAINEHYGREVITPHLVAVFKKNHKIVSGVSGRFQKGHVPYTKGKKQTDFMTAEAIERTKATRFQKGNRPVNELPVGSVVENVGGYLLRKRSMTGSQWERWEFLHRAVWEEHYGPIPRGLMVTFKDSDRKNCSIDNLMLIDKAVNGSLTAGGYRSEVPEITETAATLVKLKLAVRDKKKSRREKLKA